MNPVFLDTGYLIGLETSNDQHHKAARDHWKGLVRNLPPLVTTSYVFDEVVTIFANRNLHAKGIEVGQNLIDSPFVELVQVDEELFYEAWRYYQKHSDKSYSLTDCVSFVLMKRLGIIEALTFDKHFVQADFTRLP
ncbi:MAG: putative nucleic acid-binding protein contains domain [Acidobacteria bacterium]|nr:putative nucleic acid-binding protein contains domain [Acidobacteriota bacterium]